MQTIHVDQINHSTEPEPLHGHIQNISLRTKTVERLNRLREDGQSYDELVTELINIC